MATLQSCHLWERLFIFSWLFTEESQQACTSKAMPCRYNFLYFALCYLWVSQGWNSDNPCAFYANRHILFLLDATWVEIILLQLISNLCFFSAARGQHFYEKEELDDFFSAYIYIFFLNFYINHFFNSGTAFHTTTTEECTEFLPCVTSSVLLAIDTALAPLSVGFITARPNSWLAKIHFYVKNHSRLCLYGKVSLWVE